MKKVVPLLVLALVSLALAACGDSDDDTTTSATSTESTSDATTGGGKAGGGGELTLEFEADPDGGLAYTSDEASTQAGEVEVIFNNSTALSHDVAIEDSSGKEIGKTEIVSEGKDSTTVNLKPGEYTFYCTIPGHREGGMEGTLTVK